MATHSGILAWEIPWTEEPGGLWSQSQARLSDLSPAAQPLVRTPHVFMPRV